MLSSALSSRSGGAFGKGPFCHESPTEPWLAAAFSSIVRSWSLDASSQQRPSCFAKDFRTVSDPKLAAKDCPPSRGSSIVVPSGFPQEIASGRR